MCSRGARSARLLAWRLVETPGRPAGPRPQAHPSPVTLDGPHRTPRNGTPCTEPVASGAIQSARRSWVAVCGVRCLASIKEKLTWFDLPGDQLVLDRRAPGIAARVESRGSTFVGATSAGGIRGCGCRPETLVDLPAGNVASARVDRPTSLADSARIAASRAAFHPLWTALAWCEGMSSCSWWAGRRNCRDQRACRRSRCGWPVEVLDRCGEVGDVRGANRRLPGVEHEMRKRRWRGLGWAWPRGPAGRPGVSTSRQARSRADRVPRERTVRR